jgi:hypothetical protein
MKRKQEPVETTETVETTELGEPIPERIAVKVIGVKGGSALVEWHEVHNGEPWYHRAYIPIGRVEGETGTVDAQDLAGGIPYGLPWENYIVITATPERIANELRKRGVWCWLDINNVALDDVNRAFDRGDFTRRVREAL